MPHSTSLKTRLPSWNLLFLALLLSGGGFFWHTTQQNQLLDRLDSQLLSTAGNVAFFYDKIPGEDSAQKFLCENLVDISSLSAVTSEISIHSSKGELICFSTELNGDDQITSHKKIQPTETASLKTIVNSQGNLRLLTYPINKDGETSLYLSISSNLAGLKQQSNIFTLILFLVGIFVLTSFAVLQRKLRSRNLTAIRRLTKTIKMADTGAFPSTFKVAETAGPEVKALADSYNTMVTCQTNNLRRARQFAADVTHELRTPLTILRGETELALRNGKDQKQLRQVLVSNLEEISRMSYLIEDLLLLSKGDLGEIPLKMERLPLHELVGELHHQAQLLATAKEIKVKLHSPQEQIFLQADSLRLRQVFLNLLTNAIKYTPREGTITIDLALKNAAVTISISDSGIGMDSKHLEAIFDRFYRIDKTTNRNDGGSGLGLAIVKWIVDAHQGSVKVSSIPGQGSSFTVTLPLPQNKPVTDSATTTSSG